MLRLLLDEHVSPAIAIQLARRGCKVEVSALQEWEGGAYRGVPDPELLTAAAARGWTLVTFDRRTIVPLLKTWAEAGISHGGVVFVGDRTLSPSDIGGLVRALAQLAASHGELDWTDRVVFLTR